MFFIESLFAYSDGISDLNVSVTEAKELSDKVSSLSPVDYS
jgi:hypothetical protein